MACLPSFFFFLLCIILDWHRAVCQQLYNITVDDSDAAITYTGNWQQSTPTELDDGGKHMIALDPEASAMFTFRGVAVYFISPLWPYNLTTEIQVDSGPPTILQLRDVSSPENFGGSETVASRVIMGMENLDDQLHHLKITVSPGDQWAIVDGFIVTAINQSGYLPNTTTTAATASSSPITAATATTLATTVSPSSRESRAGTSAVPIGVGIGLGVLVLLVTVVLLYKFCYRRRTHQGDRQMVQPDVEKFPSLSTVRPHPGCVIPSTQTPPTSDTGLAAWPPSPLPIQTGLEGFSTSPPKYDTLQSPTSPSPVHLIFRRITFNRPPPAYHDSLDSLCLDNYPGLERPQPVTFAQKGNHQHDA